MNTWAAWLPNALQFQRHNKENLNGREKNREIREHEEKLLVNSDKRLIQLLACCSWWCVGVCFLPRTHSKHFYKLGSYTESTQKEMDMFCPSLGKKTQICCKLISSLIQIRYTGSCAAVWSLIPTQVRKGKWRKESKKVLSSKPQ